MLVTALAVALLIYGGVVTLRAPIDVFPDLTAPTVSLAAKKTQRLGHSIGVVVT